MKNKLAGAVLICLTLFSKQGISKEKSLKPSLDKFSLSILSFGCNRDPQTPQIECSDYKGRVSAEFDVNFLRYGFWRNVVHGEGTDSAFTTIGWRYEFGFKLNQYLELYHSHHSRHVLDREQPFYVSKEGEIVQHKFPVEDSYGIRIIFFEDN